MSQEHLLTNPPKVGITEPSPAPPPSTHVPPKFSSPVTKDTDLTEKIELKHKRDSLFSSVQELEERRGSLHLAFLGAEEESFFKLIEEGNVIGVERFLTEHRFLNINSINYQGLGALHIAIRNENEDMVKFLFSRIDLEVRDAALQAVATGNLNITSIVLDSINTMSPGAEIRGYDDSPEYSPDITPLILAAHCGDYKMVRMLLERGHTIDKPHSPSCLCPQCKEAVQVAGASLSRIRLNAYRAISNPSYICQITDDPIYYGFLLDSEMKNCSLLDKEFRAEYIELAQSVREFTVSLLSNCRNTTEIETLLKLSWGYEGYNKSVEFPRLQLALYHNQKEFVGHSMVQQVLSAYWLGGNVSWPKLGLLEKCFKVLTRIVLLPIICPTLIVAPEIRILRKYRAPLNRYLLSLASYVIFVTAVFMLNYLDSGKAKKGPPHTGLEPIIVLFVLGYIWSTFKQYWIDGRKRFFAVPWNWYDMIMEGIFIVTFILWGKSALDAKSDYVNKKKILEKKFWHGYDATLLHEGLFAVATIMSFGRLAYYCLQSSRLGPLQVSLGKIAVQIGYFLSFCFLIITSFAMPMSRLYAYYDGMTQTNKAGRTRTQLSSFSTFTNSFSTFFWAMFCMSPVESAEVVVANLDKDKENPIINTHDFTQMVGTALFATYELLMAVALLNTLIAILSNTFQKVVDNADVEWKFARTKLWTYFFNDSTRLPSPFNLLPTPQLFLTCYKYCMVAAKKVPGAKIAFSLEKCCYIERDKDGIADDAFYEELMKSLVQRYFRAKEQETL